MHPNPASTPISSNLMLVCRFLDDIGTHSETEMVDMPQVFLPCAVDAKGQTLYEKVAQSKFLLGDGRET